MKPKHPSGKPDARYTVTLEYVGYETPQHVARFCGDRIGHAADKREAWQHCTDHHRTRQEALS